MSMLLVQLALNVFGSLDLLPFTGVTFPFVSPRRHLAYLLLDAHGLYQKLRHPAQRKLCRPSGARQG